MKKNIPPSEKVTTIHELGALDGGTQEFDWLDREVIPEIDRLLESDQPIAGQWQPTTIAVSNETVGRPKTDFAFRYNFPVFSDRAVEALRPFLIENGELLPLNNDSGETYWLYHTTRIVDALDADQAEFDLFDDGKISRIKRYEFHSKSLQGLSIFTIPGWRRPYFGRVLVTDTFVRTVDQAKLRGFDFLPVWQNGKSLDKHAILRGRRKEKEKAERDAALILRADELKTRRVDDLLLYLHNHVAAQAEKQKISFDVALDRAPSAIQEALTTWFVEGEVYNGGFEQCFFNSTRRYVPQAAEAYERMGAPEHARVVRDAKAVYEKHRVRFEDTRSKVDAELAHDRQRSAWSLFTKLYSPESQLEKLTQEFYRVGKNEQIDQIRTEYLDQRSEEILESNTQKTDR